VRHNQAHHTPAVRGRRNAIDAYRKALACDPVSAFGSVIAFTVPSMKQPQRGGELVRRSDRRAVVHRGSSGNPRRKKNLRVLEGRASWPANAPYWLRGGVLVQERPRTAIDDWLEGRDDREPTAGSTAISVRVARRRCGEIERDRARRDGATIGTVPARCASTPHLAVHKAQQQDTPPGRRLARRVLPLRDGIDQAADAGVNATSNPVVQCAMASIAAANERDRDGVTEDAFATNRSSPSRPQPEVPDPLL
jgi:phosphoribosylaminoimidazolecarboxamide formyltransferase/IMP cyclohydrolase